MTRVFFSSDPPRASSESFSVPASLAAPVRHAVRVLVWASGYGTGVRAGEGVSSGIPVLCRKSRNPCLLRLIDSSSISALASDKGSRGHELDATEGAAEQRDELTGPDPSNPPAAPKGQPEEEAGLLFEPENRQHPQAGRQHRDRNLQSAATAFLHQPVRVAPSRRARGPSEKPRRFAHACRPLLSISTPLVISEWAVVGPGGGSFASRLNPQPSGTATPDPVGGRNLREAGGCRRLKRSAGRRDRTRTARVRRPGWPQRRTRR